MQRNFIFLACFMIMAMDITAGVLGIQAEIAQNKVKHLNMWIYECRDPNSQAVKLGTAALVLLLLAHIIANLLGGCIFIRSMEEFDRASPNRQLAATSLILSWIFLSIAFALLISGTIENSKPRKNCGLDDRRLLSVGGILCFIHGMFAVAYYLYATGVVEEERKQHQPKQEEAPA